MLQRKVFAVVVLGLLVAPSAHAQFAKTWGDWYGHVAGGYAAVQGDASDVVDSGWNLNGGATYKPSDWPVGIFMQLDWETHDIKREILNSFQASGGDVNFWALTAGGVLPLTKDAPIGFQLSGGIGVYHVEGRLTEPGVICGPVCPPYSWWCFPGCTPGTITTDRTSTTEFGLNLGAAVTFKVGMATQLYIEARFHYIDTEQASELIPIVLGVRF